MIDRIDDAAFIEQNRFQPAPLQLDAAGKAGRARSNNGYVESLSHIEQRSDLLIDILESAEDRAAGFFPAPSAMSGRPPPFPPTALATSPTSLPACTFPVRSLLTAEIMETFESFDGGDDNHRASPLVAQRIGNRAKLLRIQSFDLFRDDRGAVDPAAFEIARSAGAPIAS